MRWPKIFEYNRKKRNNDNNNIAAKCSYQVPISNDVIRRPLPIAADVYVSARKAIMSVQVM